MFKKVNKKIFLAIIFLLILISGFFFFFRKGEEIEATWWDDSWHYRKKFTINSSQVSADLSNFPVMISSTDSGYSGKMQTDADDVIFFNNEGFQLDHEIDYYDSTTGALTAWVRIPSLSSSQDTDIYMYYGNPSVSSQENVEGVWDANYAGVWHMNSDSGETDSTSNNNDLTETGTFNATTIEAQIGSAREITTNGNNYLSIADASATDLDGMQKLTIQAWVRDTSGDTNPRGIVAKRISSSSQVSYTSFLYTSSFFNFDNGNATGGSYDTRTVTDTETVDQNTWEMWHCTFDGTADSASRKKIYENGVLARTGSATETTIFDGTGIFFVGILNDAYAYSWLGQIDEVRILKDALSADWITTEHANQNSPGTFFSVDSEEVNPGPVGYWSFDEGYGTTTQDESSGNNDGTITNATWQEDSMCISGKCLYFDGSGDRINVSHATVLNPNSEITVSAWFYTTNKTANQGIIGKSNNTTDDGWNIRLVGGELQWQFDDNSAKRCITTDFESNKWHHVAGTWDSSSQQMKLYVDGILKNTVSSISSYTETSTDLVIGDRYPNYDYPFDGRIDEAKVYPYVKTADQIKQEYSAGLAGVKTSHGASFSVGESEQWMSDGLVGYWKMDEDTWDGTTDEVVDSSGNGNHGVRVGTASTTAGKFGNGGVFDGDSDYAQMERTGNAELDPEEVTFALWMKPIHDDSNFGAFGNIKGLSPGFTYGLRWYDSLSYDRIYLQVNTENGTKTYTYDIPNLSTRWYHWAMTFSKKNGGEVRLFMDGEEVLYAMNVGEVLDYDDGNDVVFGIKLGTPSDYFEGEVDEARVYNRALQPSEIKDLYNWAPSPVAHWKMDEMSGTSVYDISGNGNNGTMTNMSSDDWVIGKYGGALDFDGDNDNIAISVVNDVFDFGDWDKAGFTYEAWIKTDTSSCTTGDGSDVYISRYTGTVSSILACKDSNRARIQIRDSDSNITELYGTSAINDNEWHHLAGVYDKGNMYIYVDGVLENSDLTPNFTGNFNATADYYIGRHAGNYEAVAKIDDVRIYNYARNSKQIVEDMNAGHPVGGSPISSKLGYWKFDEGYGTTAHDEGFGGNDGTLVGTPIWTNDGKFGKALDFDGSSDYINAGDIQILDDTTELTISAWVYHDTISGDDSIVEKTNGLDNGGFALFRDNVGSLSGRVDTYSSILYDQDDTDLAKIEGSDNISPLQEWTHVATTIKLGEANGLRLYINGIEDANSPVSTVDISSIDSLTDPLVIGDWEDFASYKFDGKIDEVKIYNYALTEDEIKLDYNQGKVFIGGSRGTESDGVTQSFSASREYCVPGDTSTCNPPVAEWKFDEMTGTTAYDTSENSNDGTLTNNPQWRVDGKYNSALEFDSSNDYVNVPSDSSLSMTSFTISAWVNMLDDIQVSSSMGIVEHDRGGNNWYGLFKVDDTFHFRWQNTSSTAGRDNFNTTINPNTWYHVVGVHDSSDSTSRMYLNGRLDKELTGVNNPTVNDDLITIGINNSLSEDFEGLIDNIQIYDYARTPAQIAWEYNRGKPVGHWNFEEGQLTTAHDKTENANHGTLTNMDASTDWVTGKVGNYALDFDGSNDYVQIDSNLGIVSYPFTFSAWVDSDNGGTGTVVAMADASNSAVLYGLQVRDNVAKIVARNTTSYLTSGTTNLNGTGWHHLTAIFNSSTDRKIYVNGIEEGSSSDSVSWNTNVDTTLLGLIRLASPTEYFDGRSDDIRIYNYALTEEQIKQVYNEGSVIRFK